MTAQTRTQLYTYFQTNDTPTQAQFQNLIDSSLNIADASAQVIASDVSAQKLDLNGNFTVKASSQANFTGNVIASGALTVAGSAQTNLTGNVLVGGTLTVSANGGASTFSSITVTGSASITDNLTVTGRIIPSQTAGIKGTTTNNAANAGSVGEVLTATAADGSVSISTGTGKTLTSVSLTAGDWDVFGAIRFTPAGGTTVTQILGGISSVDNSVPSTSGLFAINGTLGSADLVMPTPTVRVSLSTTTIYYLAAQASFTGSTMTAGGTITARRAR